MRVVPWPAPFVFLGLRVGRGWWAILVNVSSALSTKKSFRDSAIVLRSQNLGETDRIVILLTREHGVVHAVAKGVRKPSSSFGGRLEPFMLVDFAASAGKNLATVTQVVTRRAYAAAIVGDYTVFTLAVTACEVAEQLAAGEAESAGAQFSLLAGALSALARGSHLPHRVLDSYLLRALELGGWGLELEHCTSCGEVWSSGYLRADSGVVCTACLPEQGEAVLRPLPAEMRDYLLALKQGRWELVDATVPSALTLRGSELIMEYVQWQLEKPLKSLATLEKEVLSR